VTTIIKVLMWPAVPWASKVISEYGWENWDSLANLREKGDRDGFLRLLKGATEATRERASDRGKDAHDIVARTILGQPIPKESDSPYLRAFHSFVADHPGSTFQASEAVVYNLTIGYAGTCDAIMRHEASGRLGVVDWKTRQGKTTAKTWVYESERAQVAAYQHAEYLVLPDGTVAPMPRCDGGSVVLLCEDGYKVQPIDEADFEGFKALKTAHAWMGALKT